MANHQDLAELLSGVKADIRLSVTTDILYEMSGRVWESEEIPADWKHGYYNQNAEKG